MTRIYYIEEGLPLEDPLLKEKVGIVGYSMLEQAALNIPVAPGFILELTTQENSEQEIVKKLLKEGVEHIEKITGRKLGDLSSPLLLKTCLSPGLIMEAPPVINYVGLNNQVVESLALSCPSQVVYKAYSSFLAEVSILALGMDPVVVKNIDPAGGKASSDSLLSSLADNFPQDPTLQLELTVKKMAEVYRSDPTNQDIPASLVIQYIPHGDGSSQLVNGNFVTRDSRTGEPQLRGHFFMSELFPVQKDKQEIEHLDPALLEEMDEIAGILEGFHLDIRQADFVVENGKVYVINEGEVDQKSMVSRLRILSDLQSEDQISNEEYVNSITPKELNSLLHSTISRGSVSDFIELKGGVGGSLGATSGRVFFSTKKLIEAYWKAKAEDADKNLILLKKSTFAEDVQAVEIGCGVLTSEGGYTSHAPIVARSLGKPAIVFPDISYQTDHVLISGHKVHEGDYISMEIVSAEEPAIYLGKAELEYPDIEKSGVKNLLEKAKEFGMGIEILANADNPQEARQAKILGADGIGLCRTEHMFHRDKRIYAFRDLLVTKNEDRKKDILEAIKAFLIADFKELFEIMDGKPITIRLLDAPLHEFLPTDENGLEETMKELVDLSAELSKEEIRQSFLRLKETNPMLGHRGCRVGISSPEIYDVQTTAILEAALQVQNEKNINVQPSIMIPLIMSKEEMYLLKNGQIMEGKESVKGIIGVIREFMRKNQLKRQPFDVKIGAMIELPAAAISAADIAKQAEFFSFGTNDLTQTTMGLSRDDINAFLPAYTEMDVWKNDPFQDLLEPVKVLIDQAILAGRQVRPDLKVGICGEHGANPDVIAYCLRIGMNYISCSPFGIPVAILSVAQSNLARN
jgi:pyruvate, orthophosphate dikinase